MTSAERLDAEDPGSGTTGLLALVLLALVTGAYLVARTGGLWADSDSAVMSRAIRVVADTGHLVSATQGVYDNGYGYQVVSLALMAFTGLSVADLQQLAYPVISALVVLPAWVLYRELTGSSWVATMATLLLLLVPEHLFMVLRGSHERVDRTFLLIALWLLVRSLRFRADPGRFGAHFRLVLLATYGFIATNGLFGVSFVMAMSMAWAASWLARRGPTSVRVVAREGDTLMRRMIAATTLLVVIFAFFAYPPIGKSLGLLAEAPLNLLHMLLSAGQAADPYAGVFAAWVSLPGYLALSAGEFLLLGGSAVVWLRVGWTWLRGSAAPSSLGIWLLWLLYGAFAVQGVAAILTDRTGALGGNLQYRAFAVFATMAAPVVALALSRWRPSRWLQAIAAPVLAFAAVAALLKATNEPALSNKWTFYTRSEDAALVWAVSALSGRSIWTGPDERLAAAYEVAHGEPGNANALDIYTPKVPQTTVFLVSDTIRLQSARIGATLPPVGIDLRIYDNGDTQIYVQRSSNAYDR